MCQAAMLVLSQEMQQSTCTITSLLLLWLVTISLLPWWGCNSQLWPAADWGEATLVSHWVATIWWKNGVFGATQTLLATFNFCCSVLLLNLFYFIFCFFDNITQICCWRFMFSYVLRLTLTLTILSISILSVKIENYFTDPNVYHFVFSHFQNE